MRRVWTLVKRESRYARAGLRAGRLAVDRRSRLRLAIFGATVLAKQRTPWRDRPVRVGVRLHGRDFRVFLAGRTELDVLCEIGVEDEYGPSDQIVATTIVDLGAHVGLASLRLLAQRPNARVLAVEADPMLIPRLRANVAGLPVTVVHAAVGGTSGEREFFRADDSTWGNSLKRTLPWQEAVVVPSVTLPDLLHAHGIDRVGLLKMDIEGAEWEVLADGIPDHVDAMVAEFHAMGGRDPGQLLRAISASLDVKTSRGDADRLVFTARRSSSSRGSWAR